MLTRDELELREPEDEPGECRSAPDRRRRVTPTRFLSRAALRRSPATERVSVDATFHRPPENASKGAAGSRLNSPRLDHRRSSHLSSSIARFAAFERAERAREMHSRATRLGDAGWAQREPIRAAAVER